MNVCSQTLSDVFDAMSAAAQAAERDLPCVGAGSEPRSFEEEVMSMDGGDLLGLPRGNMIGHAVSDQRQHEVAEAKEHHEEEELVQVQDPSHRTLNQEEVNRSVARRQVSSTSKLEHAL